MDTILMGRRAGSRNYPPAYKRRVVSETFESGRSVAAVARDHGLNANMVFCWRRDPRFRAETRSLTADVAFLPVEIDGKDAPDQASADLVNVEQQDSRRVEIVLGTGHRVSIEGSFDSAAIAELLKALTER